MGKTLQQILGYENLTGIIQDPKGGIRKDLLPPAFTSLTRPVEGNTAKWFAIAGNRKTARLVQYGGPSKARDLKGVTERTATMIHSFEHTYHDANTLMALQNFDNPQVQEMGQQVVDIQTGQFREGFNNLRYAAIMQLLGLGTIYFDGNGNLLPSSSGAIYTVDFQIPANNKDQCNSLLTASWATAGTPIISNIQSLMAEAYKLTGYPLEHAFYGSALINCILTNTQALALLGGNSVIAATLATGQIPNGFAGIREWHPVWGAYYEDNDGTMQRLVDTDHCIFTPEPSRDWWEILEGSFPVPNDLGAVSSDASAATGGFSKVYGNFSYAHLIADPPGIKHLAGTTFLPVLKVPQAIFIADFVF